MREGHEPTSDLDVFTRNRGVAFEDEFRKRLSRGWGTVPPSKGQLRKNPDASFRVAFTGSLRIGRVYNPRALDPAKLMHPYRVSIGFLGRNWAALDVEVSGLEIDGQGARKLPIDGDLAAFGALFGFGSFAQVGLIDLEYQIAEKIHAVTDPNYERAHDLVDLQLLWSLGVNLPLLRGHCLNVFHSRRQQTWPPLPLRPMDGWSLAYKEARDETLGGSHTSILEDIERARNWLGEVIERISES